MKNKIIMSMMFSFILSIMTARINAQNNIIINQLEKDANGNAMLVGKCDRSSLLNEPFSIWYNANYSSYLVDSFTCTFIKPLLAGKKITIFLGTWCGDSKREVPRILKILDCCEFPQSQLNLIMLSNQAKGYKKSPQHEEEGKNIIRVPTMIIEENGKEIGRIIEFPKITLEKDLLTILKRENYIPNYHNSEIIGKKD